MSFYVLNISRTQYCMVFIPTLHFILGAFCNLLKESFIVGYLSYLNSVCLQVKLN